MFYWLVKSWSVLNKNYYFLNLFLLSKIRQIAELNEFIIKYKLQKMYVLL
jgi:hypothetical protein